VVPEKHQNPTNLKDIVMPVSPKETESDIPNVAGVLGILQRSGVDLESGGTDKLLGKTVDREEFSGS
jgi:hypothetical protein